MLPTVSCIITAFNNERYLATAVESVLSQTLLPHEIILSDDASTDKTLEIMHRFAKNNHSVTVISHDHTLGAAENRNQAIGQTTGEYVTYVDGDDYLLPHKLDADIRCIRARQSGVAFSSVQWVDADGSLLHLADHSGWADLSRLEMFRLIAQKKILPRNVLLSRALFDEIGGFRSGMVFAEDYDFALRLAAVTSFAYSEVFGYAYRQHQASLTHGPLRPIDKIRSTRNLLWQNRDLLISRLGHTGFTRLILYHSGRTLQRGFLAFKQRGFPVFKRSIER